MSLRVHPLWASLSLALISLAPAVEEHPAGPTPKPVTLKLEKTTAVKALSELSKQTGITVKDSLQSKNTFKLDLTKTTFWPALDAIAKASNSYIDLYPRDGQLALVRQPAGYVRPPTSYNGLFRSIVKGITASLDQETGITTYAATIEVAWEPTLLPLLLDTSPRNFVVRDERGQALPTREEGSAMAPVDGRFAKTFDVPLPTVSRLSLELSLLEGKLVAVAPNKMLTFTFDSFDNLAKMSSPSVTQDGVSCRLKDVQLLGNERWTMQVSINYPPGGVTLESYQSWVVNNQLILESPDGKKQLMPNGYVVDKMESHRAEISYHFLNVEGRPSDWKVLYRTPANLVEIPLTFSFKGVPLP